MVRGWELRLFFAGGVSASLLSVHACRLQDKQLTAGSQEDSGCALISCPCWKAVHSPRRVSYCVRISFEKLTNPRLKWLAALVKFQDGKEFEPKGYAFQVKGALSNAATFSFTQSLASVRFCVYEWFSTRAVR